MEIKLNVDLAKDIASSMVQEYNILLETQGEYTKSELEYIFVSNQEFIIEVLNSYPDEEEIITVEMDRDYLEGYFKNFIAREIDDFKDMELYIDYVEELKELQEQIM